MSHLTYYAYEGAGVYNRKAYHYNQAVRIPASADRVELAGQGMYIITTLSQNITEHHRTSHAIRTISTNALPGGWDPKTSEVKSDLLEEIDQAFSNVELALKDAGIEDGWKSVFRVTSYHAGFDGDQERVFGKMVANFEKYMPGHEPIWTCVGVTALALPQMRIEIEVVAIDGK
jgi:enamine deaminase RidA (YjgF/YER057c/UK114 family)